LIQRNLEKCRGVETVHINTFMHLDAQLGRLLETKNDSNYQLGGLKKLLELLV
jgi:hypothetical protein